MERSVVAAIGFAPILLALVTGCAATDFSRSHRTAKASDRPSPFSLGSPQEHAESAASYRRLAEQYHRQQRPEMAIELYRAALARSPNDVQARYLLAHALGSTGEWDEAVREARRAVRERPDFVEAEALLGILLRRAGRPEEAWPILERSWQDHRSEAAGLELARWNLARNRPDLAAPIIRTCSALHPDSPDWLQVASQLERMQRYDSVSEGIAEDSGTGESAQFASARQSDPPGGSAAPAWDTTRSARRNRGWDEFPPIP